MSLPHPPPFFKTLSLQNKERRICGHRLLERTQLYELYLLAARYAIYEKTNLPITKDNDRAGTNVDCTSGDH